LFARGCPEDNMQVAMALGQTLDHNGSTSRDVSIEAYATKRSRSTPVGKSERDMSFLPKRATQHMIFLTGDERPCVALKIGQQQVDRHLYIDEAKALGETYVETALQNGSMYTRSLANARLPEDYGNPPRRLRQPEMPKDFGRSGSNWKSEYRSGLCLGAIAGHEHFRQHGAPYEASWFPQSSMGQAGASTYCEDFGLLGSNPRSLIKPYEAAMPVIRNSLNFGTTKGTGHIPGYQGFLSATPNAGTAGERPAHDRTHYHRNLVGYAGHVPESAQNEGRRKQSDLTTMDRDYTAPNLRAFG